MKFVNVSIRTILVVMETVWSYKQLFKTNFLLDRSYRRLYILEYNINVYTSSLLLDLINLLCSSQETTRYLQIAKRLLLVNDFPDNDMVWVLTGRLVIAIFRQNFNKFLRY